MDIYRLSLIVVLSICIQNAYAKIYKWVDEEGNVQFSDKPPPSQRENFNFQKNPAPEVKPEQKTYNSVLAEKPSVNNKPFSEDIILSVRVLLDGKKFIELNEVLHAHQTAAEKNIYAEDALFTAYNAFEIKSRSYESIFNEWVNITPDNYQPYLARARFYYRLAWEARGGKWASETKKDKLEMMKTYFSKSAIDIVQALKLYEKSMIAYSLLIGIYNAVGKGNETELIVNKAIGFNSATFHVRRQYLRALTPRWGGSYEKMKLFVIDSMRYVNSNPKLKLLEGYIYLDLANLQQIIKKYSIAGEYYNKALEFGLNHKILKERGENSYRRENYKEALKDFSRAIKLYTEDADYYYWRSKTYRKLKQYTNATTDIERAYELDPYDKYILSQRNWLSSKMTYLAYQLSKNQKPTEAIKKYDIALSLDPANADLHYRKARALIESNKHNQALKEIEQAIQINSDDINYYLLVDYILAKSRSWDKIIHHWDNFIKRNPNVSRAYVERGGSYYRKGDMKSAVKNAKLAADMGNLEGKEAYEKFKHFE